MVSKRAVFTPSLSETKAANTTSVVKDIVDKQSADRQAKTDRLRAARLQQEAAKPAPKAKRAAAKPS